MNLEQRISRLEKISKQKTRLNEELALPLYLKFKVGEVLTPKTVANFTEEDEEYMIANEVGFSVEDASDIVEIHLSNYSGEPIEEMIWPVISYEKGKIKLESYEIGVKDYLIVKLAKIALNLNTTR